MYRVYVTLEGYVEYDAISKKDALDWAEDGFSIDNFCCENVEIGDVEEVKDVRG